VAVPKDTIWPLEPHTAAKHEILRRYLAAWFPIINTGNNEILYIDGFCGPGRYTGGEEGSPLIALQVARTHRKPLTGKIHFWFIDEDKDRIDFLERELLSVERPSHFHVHTNNGRFHEVIGSALDALRPDQQLFPTFAFIDPFGFSGIPYSIVRRLLQQPKCEVFVTFMVDSINRWITAPNDVIRKQIVDTFDSVRPLEIITSPGDRVGNLRALYQSKLSEDAKYVRYFEMRDTYDRPIYYLFFATNNPLGHVKMKEAMWKVDPQGHFRFSDGTNPDQMILFQDDPTHKIADDLTRQFSGKGVVPVARASSYIENETGYLRKQMLAALRLLEKDQKLIANPVKRNGGKRMKNTFPDDVLIRIA
jgi:three-Cys-motif partner protein